MPLKKNQFCNFGVFYKIIQSSSRSTCVLVFFLTLKTHKFGGGSLIFFSLTELKVQANFLIACTSVCLTVRKLFTLSSSSQVPLSHFQPNLTQSIPVLGWREFKFVQMEDHALFQEGKFLSSKKYIDMKILFTRTTMPIPTKLGSQYPCMGELDFSLFKWRATCFSEGR